MFHTESGENLLLPVVSSSFPHFSQSFPPFSFFGSILFFSVVYTSTGSYSLLSKIRSVPLTIVILTCNSYAQACMYTRLTARGFAQLRVLPLRQFDRVRSSKLPRNGTQNCCPRFTWKSREQSEQLSYSLPSRCRFFFYLFQRGSFVEVL